jgi:hypothetical protein
MEDHPSPQPPWPHWWSWEVELNPHLLKRMVDRSFPEADLRAMLHDTVALRPDIEPNRWVAATTHEGRPWAVIVEPDPAAQLLVVVTAYPV